MSESNKNSDLTIIGIVAIFVAYLIYSKSKTSQLSSQQLSSQQLSSQQLSSQQLSSQQNTQTIDNSLHQLQIDNNLTQLQMQLHQTNDILKEQMNKLQLIQEQQLKHLEIITKLENENRLNTVLMNNNTKNIDTIIVKEPNDIRNATPLNNKVDFKIKDVRILNQLNNMKNESEELTSERLFGMR